MVMFNSYVNWPEGRCANWKITTCFFIFFLDFCVIFVGMGHVPEAKVNSQRVNVLFWRFWRFEKKYSDTIPNSCVVWNIRTFTNPCWGAWESNVHRESFRMLLIALNQQVRWSIGTCLWSWQLCYLISLEFQSMFISVSYKDLASQISWALLSISVGQQLASAIPCSCSATCWFKGMFRLSYLML